MESKLIRSYLNTNETLQLREYNRIIKLEMFKYLKDFIDSILNMHDDDHNHDIEHKKLKEWVKNELK